MRIAWLAVLAACLSRAAGGLANAGNASSDTSAPQTCVSISHVTETSALKTLTTTLTFHANHTRFNATSVRNGTGSRLGIHSTQGHASLPTSKLTTSSSDALVVCPPGSTSAACPCYSIVRSTTTVTVPKTTITATTTAFTNGTRLPWHPTSRAQTATGTSSASRKVASSGTPAPSSFLVTGNSAGAPFLDTSTSAVPSRKPSVVYVVNSTTTLITITTSSSKGSVSVSSISRGSDTTTGRYIHPLSTQGNSSLTASARPPFPRNSTSTRFFLNATSAAARLNTSIPSLLVAPNTTQPVWLNTSSAATTTARITNKPWLNFSTFPAARTNTSMPIWLNTSLPRITNATITTAPPRWLNTSISSTATTSATPTSSAIPGCTAIATSSAGAANFSLQVSQPGGTFNNWFLRTSGVGLLFTRQSAQASAFGLGGGGELCALGLVDEEGVPYLAVVESRNVSASGSSSTSTAGTVVGGGVGETGSGSGGGNGGSVWLVAQSTLQALRDDYTALRCEKGSGGGLSCREEDGEARDAQYWVGCGMQLDLSSDPSGEGPGRGLNCSAVGLGVVQG